MYTISNRLKVKKGYGVKMAPMFTSGVDLENFEGFHKIEVNLSTTHEEYDELNVMMHWDEVSQFQAWRESDSFKNAHKRDASQGKGESPVLSNEVVIAEIFGTKLAAV